jgi:hypothetical protein
MKSHVLHVDQEYGSRYCPSLFPDHHDIRRPRLERSITALWPSTLFRGQQQSMSKRLRTL